MTSCSHSSTEIVVVNSSVSLEFIPLSFWYDAPLTSQYSFHLCTYIEQEAPLWPVVRFADVQSRPTEFLDFTSLILDEFQLLIPPFEAAFQAHMAAWRFDGTPRTARRFTVYKHCPCRHRKIASSSS